MTPAIAQFLTDADALTRMVDRVDLIGPDAWSAPSPCADWSAAGVVDHLIDAEREFLIGRGLDLGPAPTGTPTERWAAHLGVVRRVLADDSAATTPYDGFFGPSTVEEALTRFYGFDLIVHRWDLAQAVDLQDTWSDDELDRIEQGIEGFGPALYADGVCAAAREAPAGASRQQALLARLGRTA